MVRILRVLFVEVPILGGLLLAAAGFAVGWGVRYQWIEPTAIGILCDEGLAAPWWCGPRTALIAAIQSWPGRVLAPMLAVLPWLVRRRAAARRLGLLALFVVGAGLVLYNAGPAVIALVPAGLGLIRLEQETSQA